jgi:hypothetical protein
MTRQEIEDLAIQAGIKSYALGMATEEAWQQTERFVELILKKGKESMKEITEITDYPMNMKDLVARTNTNSLSLFDLKPDYNVMFHNGDHNIGRLDFNGGVMVFEGAAEESAKIFFDALAEKFADRLKEEREKEREACAQIADEEAQLFGITDDVVAHRIRERGEDRFEIKEDRIHKDLPGRRVAKAAGARIEE